MSPRVEGFLVIVGEGNMASVRSVEQRLDFKDDWVVGVEVGVDKVETASSLTAL
jgi:hypothetical protein